MTSHLMISFTKLLLTNQTNQTKATGDSHLQMLEASRNASRFEDTIEYAIFAHASGLVFNRASQSIIEVLEVQVNTCFEVNDRICVLESIIESCLKIRVLQSIIESHFAVNNRLLINMKQTSI